MRQIWITKRGGPEVLQVRETAELEPRSDEVRIAVQAAGVNFADIMIRIGIYPHGPRLPAVVGYEVAGIVDAVGDDVEGLEVGTRVMAFTPQYGGYSEQVTLPADQILLIPDRLSFAEAAAVPVNYITAWLLLMRLAQIQPGERVLIHSIAGGVGQAALQIALWRGAQVLGTASASKHARLIEAGVEHCIDYRTQDFLDEVMNLTQGEGVDVVLDGLGGSSLGRSYRCLRPLGRVCVFGVSNMATGPKRNLWKVFTNWLAMPRFAPLKLLSDNRGVFGLSLGELKEQAPVRLLALRRVLKLMEEGELHPVVDQTFPFEQAQNAHRRLENRENLGKVVLVPEP